jgi:hypothetical protein
VDRATADEALADEARRQLREHGFAPIKPDDRIRRILAPDELVVAVRRSVSLERRVGRPESGAGQLGDLYVTTERLVHLGDHRVDFPLSEIRDAIEAEGTLRLVVAEEPGIEIEVDDPRLLRVEIAAVRESARSSTGDGMLEGHARSPGTSPDEVALPPPATDGQASSR